jgi:putative phage-type endonuclease
MGLSKWATPLSVYLEKIGEGQPVEETPAMHWGTALEPVILSAYQDQTGLQIAAPGLLRHDKHPFVIGTPDGIAVDRIVEAKTARSAEGWGEPGSDEIPEPYILQVQHYMMLTGKALADVAVLIGGSDFRVYTVPADPELQGMMLDAEASFWSRVQDRIPPEPVTYADAVARFGRASKAASVVATEEIQQEWRDLVKTRAQIAKLEIWADKLQGKLTCRMGKNDTLVDERGNVLATWKAAKAPARFTAAAFAIDYPDLFEQYSKPGTPSRRFLIKENQS